MKLIKCTLCGEEKPETEFGFTGGPFRRKQCKVCRSAYDRARLKEKRKDPEFVEKERARSNANYYRLYRNKKLDQKDSM
jgi:sarcosine oxidase delta subunit